MSLEGAVRPLLPPAPLLLHVGYHKTGSTFLQNLVFNDPRRGFTTDTGRPRHHIAQDFVRPDLFKFDAAAVRASYEPALRKARDRGLTAVVSHERLSGYPANGGHDRILIAERLAAVFGEAKVLIILREQSSLIRSMYSQYITDGGDQPIANFLVWPAPHLGRMPHFRFEFYEFDDLIMYYQSLFGARNVLVLPFELLIDMPQEFVRRIGHFCGREQEVLASTRRVNDRRPLVMQAVQRLANRHFSRNELSPTAILPIANLPKRFGRLRALFDRLSPRAVEARLERRLRARIEAAIETRYEESNVRSSRLIGIDLSVYGYACSSPGESQAADDVSCASRSS